MNSVTRRPTANDMVKALLGDVFRVAQSRQPVGRADGGVLLEGPGDGRSDDISASLDAPGDVRVSRGEYVIPADVVSALGEGSTDAGAERLDAMVEKWRGDWAARTKKFPSPGENDGEG